MNERPILFSAPMVRALLDGTKTQTRRICKNKIYGNGIRFDGNEFLCHNDHLPPSATLMDVKRGGAEYVTSDHEGWESECPYGQPGDRLWVREAWRACRDLDRTAPRDIEPDSDIEYEATKRHYAEIGLVGKLRPSMFMPRWASRITLEIVSVRVERLQDISRGDAMAEGCPFPNMAQGDDPRQWYADLWGQINGPGSWDLNPWVWVIEFKRGDNEVNQ